MPKYAEGTTVPVSKTKYEIETLLKKYGATKTIYAEDQETKRATILFQIDVVQCKFVLSLPDESEFSNTEAGRTRTDLQIQKAYEAEERRLWRAFYMVLKSKFVAVESGIMTFQEEFLNNILMPDGQITGAHVLPRVAEAYKTGKMPSVMKMLPE